MVRIDPAIVGAASSAASFVGPRIREFDECLVSVPLIPGGHQPAPIIYLPGEIVADAASAGRVAELLPRLLDAKPEPTGEPTEGGPVGFAIPERFDPLEVVRRLRALDAGLVVSVHHVLTLAQRIHIGPGSDPLPATTPPVDHPKVDTDLRLAVVDTGAIAPVPPLVAGARFDDPGDLEELDVQPVDGVLDRRGAAHGAFIGGVIRNRLPGVGLELQTAYDGQRNVITETSLAAGLAAIDRDCLAVVNLSLGTYGAFGERPIWLLDALRRLLATDADLMVVAAAGNDATDDPWYPAAFAVDPEFRGRVVSVGALERVKGCRGPELRPADFSNYGSWVLAWAPGVDVVSCHVDGLSFEYFDSTGGSVGHLPFEGLASWSGTSFAAPVVGAEIVRRAAGAGVGARQAWWTMSAPGTPVIVT